MNTVLFKKSAVFSIIGAVFLLAGGQAAASSRIKDIADFEGVRENQLVGYGLVVGLNGTGDNIKSINFAKESLISMLDQLGINARDGQLKSKTLLPSWSRPACRPLPAKAAGLTLWSAPWAMPNPYREAL